MPPSLPQHVAIIMDGNGRWAQMRGLTRSQGHSRGVSALRRTIEHILGLDIPYLTLFSFSSENWRRPQSEIDALMTIIHKFAEDDIDEIKKNNIRVRIIGRRDNLDEELCELIAMIENETCENSGLNLTLAFNYGARDEMVRAIQNIAQAVEKGETDRNSIDERLVGEHLDTGMLPDPDLIIRTGGDERLSNFLLWQAAYAELIFDKRFWPDFDGQAFEEALAVYASRERRFGDISRNNDTATAF